MGIARCAARTLVYPIRLVVVGKPKAESIILLENHYEKLIKTCTRLETVELQEGRGQAGRHLLDEAGRIKGALSPYRRQILLCADGRQRSSEEFASWLGERVDLGETVAFAIGSSHGFHPSLKTEVGEHLSLGPMTFPHDLCRIIFLEQLYRAFAILKGRKYHK
jgi:23S rRNA (pseudouridine1915-N3)-methyltransferase